MKKISLVAVVLLVTVLVSGAAATTLEEVRQRGYLRCGVSTGLVGFSKPDARGRWTGLDVDTCRAVASAVLGDADKVKFTPLTVKECFTRLQAGEIDLLARNIAWTLTRDTSLGLNFTHTSFYDEQRIMVARKLGIESAGELDGSTVCLQVDSPAGRRLADFFAHGRMKFKGIPVTGPEQAASEFEAGRCDVLTFEQATLYDLRSRLSRPDEAVILPEVVAREPLGPVVRQGDDGWFNIVRWSLFAMLDAEELGVTSDNVEKMKTSVDPAIRRLLGMEGIRGAGLGLPDDWAYQIIRQVGNYGQVFERNLGRDSVLKMKRGLNALWNHGGLQYAPPFR